MYLKMNCRPSVGKRGIKADQFPLEGKMRR